MSGTKFNPSTIILVAIVVLVSAFRIAAPYSDDFKEIANFSAVGAIALFGGAYFNNNLKAFGFPLAVLLISDIFIAQTSGYGFFYGGWYWTYIAFVLMVLASKALLKKKNVQSMVTATLAVVLIHWIVADISAMYVPGLYPPTLAGFGACLIAAIPFELKFLYGTVIYGAVMFGFMAWYPALSFKKGLSA
ncbi:MAG: DUF6580 family putative transport protein [Pedobacter sp.]|uniref:DUF6580 family putative transport protein n=1 Tax=Pedobacter sp. TaxID=1411316 RepID=UPI0035624A64